MAGANPSDYTPGWYRLGVNLTACLLDGAYLIRPTLGEDVIQIKALPAHNDSLAVGFQHRSRRSFYAGPSRVSKAGRHHSIHVREMGGARQQRAKTAPALQ